MRFYLTVECQNCDSEIQYGPVLTLIEHNGLPAIPYDMAATTSFDCDRCGAQNFTGDFEVECEGGTDPNEIDDEDDGSDED